jgi:hypothetical protein
LARKDYPHDKRLYVPTRDFKLWENFAAGTKPNTSRVIMKLIRLYVAGKLFDETGKQLVGL